MSLFSSVKDGLKKGMDLSASRIVRQLLQERLAPYGDLKDLTLDSKARTIRAELDLKGEPAPLEVVVERYELVAEGEERFLVIRSVRTSKPWISLLLKDFLIGRRFVLPAKYAGLIEKLLQ